MTRKGREDRESDTVLFFHPAKDDAGEWRSGLLLPDRFDGGRVGAVAQTEHGGEDKQSLNADCLPDPSAEQGDEDGDQVIDGHTGGNGGPHFIRTV